jgi:hypothetical protein
MTEKEIYICRDCSLECEIKQNSDLEREFPTICPHGLIPHYTKPPFKLRVKCSRDKK